MDRGLHTVPDTEPPVPTLGSHSSLFSSVIFTLGLVKREEVGGGGEGVQTTQRAFSEVKVE